MWSELVKLFSNEQLSQTFPMETITSDLTSYRRNNFNSETQEIKGDIISE